MIDLKYETIKEMIISKYGSQFFYTEPYDLNIFGVRSNNYEPNTFDDIIGIAYTNEAGFKKCITFEATTDPSTYYLLNPANPKGTGILPSGHYKSLFRIGTHNGYPALVQNKPCTIIRDVDRNKLAEFDVSKAKKFDTGMFGLNLHRYNGRVAIRSAHKGSMLCQVICDPIDFDLFMRICEAQVEKTGFGTFSYTLFWEEHENGI